MRNVSLRRGSVPWKSQKKLRVLLLVVPGPPCASMFPVARYGFAATRLEGQFVGLMRFEPAPAGTPFQGFPSAVPAAALQRFGMGRKFSIACPYFSDAESKLERYWEKFAKPELLALGVKYAPVVGFRSEFATMAPFEFV